MSEFHTPCVCVSVVKIDKIDDNLSSSITLSTRAPQVCHQSYAIVSHISTQIVKYAGDITAQYKLKRV